MAALLNPETRHVSDQSAKKALEEASSRLALIGKLHRNLYDPEGAEIDFDVFLKTLCDDINLDSLINSIKMTLPTEQSIPSADRSRTREQFA